MRRPVSISEVAFQAATLLDATHDQDGRGPRTFQARRRLAAWLDTGDGSLRQVCADMRWLRALPAGEVVR